MVRTTLQASISKTATFNGTGVAIATLANPSNVLIRVTSLTAAKVAIFSIQTSADSFSSDIRTEKVFNFYGPFASTCPQAISINHYHMPGLRVGVTSAAMRIALIYIDSAATVVYESFLTTGA